MTKRQFLVAVLRQVSKDLKSKTRGYAPVDQLTIRQSAAAIASVADEIEDGTPLEEALGNID